MQQPSDAGGKKSVKSESKIGTSFKDIKALYQRDLKEGHRWFSDGHYNDGHRRYDDDDPECLFYNCS